MSAETMKMPEPIIEPATSIVASVSVSALTNSRDDVAVSAPVAVVAVKALPRALGLRGSLPPALRRKLGPPSRFCQGINQMSYAKIPTLVRRSFQNYQPWFAVRFRNTNPDALFVSEYDLDFRRVPRGGAVGMYAGPEPHRTQHLRYTLVVIAVAGRVEPDEFCIPFLVHIEEGLHVKSLHCLRCRHRWYEQVSHRRRIILARTPAGSRPDATSATGAFARADAAAAARSGTRRIRAARALPGRCGSDLR